jgi:hypothetical protein
VRRLRHAPRAPLAVAVLLATPLFFASLMAFSLAVERPGIVHGKPTGATSSTEAKIWLLALLPSLAVSLVGLAATLVPRGVLASAAAAIVATLIVIVPLGTWERRHTGRYPDGVDLIAKGDSSDIFLRGEWEQTARQTAASIAHWTIALAVAAAVIAVALELAGRRKRPPVPPPPEIVGGQPQVTPRAGG